MKVLHVYCEFMPDSSGVARHIDGLAAELSHNGVTVTVFSSTPCTPVPGRSYRLLTGKILTLWREVRACDVVHAHGSRTTISALALLFARWLGKPSVFTPHCYYQGGSRLKQWAKAMWDRCIERASVARANAVILLHDGWSATLDSLGLHPRRTAIVPNCIDARRLLDRWERTPPLPLSGSPALLTIGRLDPVKRLDDVLQALTDPHLSRAELHIVGRGQDRDRLQALSVAAGLQGRVHFLGWQDDDKSTGLMKGCDAMVLASEREGLPTVVLEALATETPIAISDIDGNRAVADPVGWPHHFPLGNHAALATTLLACGSGTVPPDVRDRVIDTFSWQGRIDEILALYRSIQPETKGFAPQ